MGATFAELDAERHPDDPDFDPEGAAILFAERADAAQWSDAKMCDFGLALVAYAASDPTLRTIVRAIIEQKARDG